MNKLVVLLLGLGLTTTSNAQVQNNNGLLSKLSKESVLEILNKRSDYTQVHIESSDGKHDTIWTSGVVYENNNTEKKKKTVINDAVYPANSLKIGEEGKIEATCIVEVDGTLSNIKLVNSISPEIDQEAIRILSKANQSPLRIGNKSYRSRDRFCILFEIEEKDRKKTGTIYYTSPDYLCKGVSKRYRKRKWYIDEWTSRDRTVHSKRDFLLCMEIDIPQNAQELESVLCNLLFEKKGTSIELIGNKFTKKFDDETDLGNILKGGGIIRGGASLIFAHATGYKKNKYFSYGWHVSLDNLFNTDADLKASHNFIYDIQNNKTLSISDVITTEVQLQIKKTMGIRDLDDVDLGLDDKFLYIGKIGEKLATIGLSKENWDKFASPLRNLIGPVEELPNSINEKDYLFDNKFGIQPELLRSKILKKPSVNGIEFEELMNNYIDLSDVADIGGKTLTADVSFVVEKDGTVSNVDIIGNSILSDKVSNILQRYKWQPLQFADNTFGRDLLAYKYVAHNNNDNNKDEVFSYVDQLAEFQGGGNALLKWTMENLEYPLEAIEKKIEGRVFVSCVVEKDGSITNPSIQRSVDPSIDTEALRLVKNMPKWNPALKEGNPVRSKQTIPVLFRLKFMQK